MKTLAEIESYLDALYPKSISEDWDNDGMMMCLDKGQEVRRIVLCLDVTADVIKAALDHGADLIISHHPFIFSGERNLDFSSERKRLWPELINNKVAVMSYHTRLDAAIGGLNDHLASVLELTDVECFGLEGEKQPLGRIGTLSAETDAFAFCRLLKDKLGAHPKLYKSDAEKIKRVALVTGGGKDYIKSAAIAGADVFVTGDLSYNASLEAALSGMSVVDAGHYETERIVTALLKQRLVELDEGLEIIEEDSGKNRVFCF